MDQEEPEIQTSQMLCPNCAGRNPASVNFCAHCGQRTRPENGGCSNCLTELPPDAQSCPECGVATGFPMGWFLPAEVEYMGFWIRAAAGLIDAAIIMTVSIMISMMIFIAMGISSVPPPTDLPADLPADPLTDPLTNLITNLITSIASITSLVYYVALTGLKGQTLGKMALGIMVVNAQGKVPGIRRAAFREIVGKLVCEITIFLGYVWVGWDRKKRGWHDHIARTYVVRAPGRRERPAKQH